MTIQAYQFAGGEGFQPVPNLPVISPRAPATTDIISANGNPYQIGQYWQNTSTGNVYFYTGGGVWILVSIISGGSVNTITGDTGGALTPTAGNINILGTANQITVSGAGSTETLSVPATFIAPGSIAATTSLTATLGNITATNGNFVASTAGKGLVFPVATGSGASPGPVTSNGRQGSVTFTGLSIAGGAVLALTMSNSSITGAATQILYTLVGATTGAALTIQSVVNSAGSSVITIANGTGATTTTANITFNFLILN
jgi:hypothetical protein